MIIHKGSFKGIDNMTKAENQLNNSPPKQIGYFHFPSLTKHYSLIETHGKIEIRLFIKL